MSVTKDQILGILYKCIEEVNEQLAPEQQLERTSQTVLLGTRERSIHSDSSTSSRSSLSWSEKSGCRAPSGYDTWGAGPRVPRWSAP